MQLVKRFEKNTVGRDFVVGDLHGHFHWVDKWMEEVDFTVGVDRLFSVGDLIDRGPESDKVLHYLGLMAGCVPGNHEDMLVGFHRKDPMFNAPNVLRNGGAWYVGMTPAERQPIVDAFAEMPYVIEVETDFGLIGIIHAEVGRQTNDWNEFVKDPLSFPESRYGMPSCLWGRDRIAAADQSIVENVAMIIVGHTPVKEPSRYGNHNYIDTGAAYGHEPTFVKIQGA